MDVDDPIRRAADLIRVGRREEARPVLARYLQDHPESADGWMLMSMCISDRQRQIDCLRQVLRLQPDNSLARSRLNKLSSSTGPVSTWPGPDEIPAPAPKVSPFTEPPAATVAQPAQAAPAVPPPTVKTRAPAPASSGGGSSGLGPILFVGVLVAALCAVLAIGAYWLSATRRAQETQAHAAAATIAAYTLPPTWTPTFTPTISLTPTARPTVTLTPTPTPPRPNPTILSEMDQVQVEVADVRGLEPLETEIPRFLLSKTLVRPVLAESFESSGGSREALQDQVRVLSALGLIKPTYDLYTNALNGLTDNIGGFYFPWNDELYVIGTRFSGVERWVFSHEYAHALVDQHYDIGDMGVYPTCTGDAQRCEAIRALVEGDATLSMNQWLEQYASPQDYLDIFNYQAPAYTLPEQFPPPYLGPDSQFPYQQGLAFVEAVYGRGRWAAVNQVYGKLPDSTEQILHPQKYFAGEKPISVSEVPLQEVLGEGWRLLESNSLGEWMTYLLLGYGADVDSQLADSVARAAAVGWGGDRYQVYVEDATGKIALAARWTWDTAPDSYAFRGAMDTYLNGRFGGNRLPAGRGECWEANAQRTCLYSSGKDILWLLAPDASVLESMLTRYPSFR
jgi:hypothetical protein